MQYNITKRVYSNKTLRLHEVYLNNRNSLLIYFFLSIYTRCARRAVYLEKLNMKNTNQKNSNYLNVFADHIIRFVHMGNIIKYKHFESHTVDIIKNIHMNTLGMYIRHYQTKFERLKIIFFLQKHAQR